MPLRRSATRNVRWSSASGDPYETFFAATENPLSESSIWTGGATTGLDWKDMRSTGGKGFGTGASADYDDNIAAIQGRFNTQKHFVETTLVLPGGYSPAVQPEVEHHVGCTIAAHSINTYEMDFVYDPGTNEIDLRVAHWYGALGNVDVLIRAPDMSLISGTPNWAVVNGDVWRTEYNSTSGTALVNFYRNAGSGPVVLQCSYHDVSGISPILSGSPGIGAFWRADASIDAQKCCFSRAKLGSLP